MTIPDYQSLMLPLIERAALGETRIPEIEDALADRFGLTADERATLKPSGRQRVLSNRLQWAKFYLSRAGLIDLPRRGSFTISELGRQLLARKPERIDLNLLLTYPSFATYYRSGRWGARRSATDSDGGGADASPESAAANESAVTPEEQIEVASTALHVALRIELLERIWQNSPAFFEEAIVSLLLAMGYGGSHRNAAEHLGRSGDGGVDGVIDEDRLGLDRIYVQAKRWAENRAVGRPDVQAFVGSLVGRGAVKGVFATTSTFSADAREYTRHLPQRVVLIDGSLLADLMIEHNIGVRINQTLELKRLDDGFFAEGE